MRFLLATQLLLALASAGIVPRKASYDGAKVFRMPVGHESEKVKTIINDLHLSTWNGDAKDNSIIDLFVPAEKVIDFEDATLDLDTEIMHEDLGASIAEESNFSSFSGATNMSWFESYHPLSDHMRWIDDLQASYPDNSAVIVSGESYEGRPIKGLHIFGNDGPGNRPAIVWHGTIHAREWITTMVVEYMTWSLLSNYTTDPEIKKYIDSYDHYIFPVANPDGFLFAQTTDRLWRKNRFLNEGNSCVGVDLNRNWDSHWDTPGGASTNPCAQTYKGLAPADQAEIQAHQSYLQQLVANPLGIKMFIDWHAYSQLFLTPYGWTCNELPPNNDDHQRLAQAFAQGLKSVYGTEYTTGPACNTIYQTTGSSDDYAYEKASAEFSFAAELRDTGRFGFVLPPSQIIPSGIETFTGYKALLDEIM